MLKFIVQCSFLFFISSGYSQVAFQCRYEWQAVDYVGEAVQAIFPAPNDSGYLSLHTQYTSQDTGLALLKIGSDGSVIWSNIYKSTSAGPGILLPQNMIQLSDSTILVSGYLDNQHCSLKLDYSGNIINARKFPYSSGVFSNREVNGFLYSVGSTTSVGVHGGLFCKRNLDGDILWSVKMSGGASRSVRITCLTPTSDNGFLLAGWRYFFNTGSPTPPIAPILIKTDSIGIIQWQTQLNFSGTHMEPIQVEELPDHGFMFTMSSGMNGAGVFLRTDSTGQVLWNYYYNDNNQNLIFTKFETLANNQFMASGIAGYRILPFIIDSTGIPVMSKEITHGDSARVQSFYYDHNGWVGFGHKTTFTARALFIAKTDSTFHGACGESNLSLNTYSHTVTDSAPSIVAIPVTINMINADSSIAFSYYPITKTDYCPPLYLTMSDEQNPLPVNWGPVPAHDIVTFTTDYSNMKLLKIFDINGRMVDQVTFSDNFYILNRKNLKPGIYFFELSSENAIKRGKIMFK